MRKRLRSVAGWGTVLAGLLMGTAWGAPAPVGVDGGSAPLSAGVAARGEATDLVHRLSFPAGAAPSQTEPPVRVCSLPRSDAAQPEPTNELRVARDSNGDYWQIQWGCRHRVVPLAMDPVALRAIPQGEDVSLVTFGVPTPLPTPAPLDLPAYAVVPQALRPTALPQVPTPRPFSVPGYLQGYINRVLVYDLAEPDAIYLLEGGLRHRLMVFYPYCVVYPHGLPLCPGDAEGGVIDLARGGDPTVAPPYPYLLRRNPNLDCGELYEALRVLPQGERSCRALYEQMFREELRRQGVAESDAIRLARRLAAASADYVATIEEVPLGEPAPYYGWGRGESSVLSARPGLPDAVRCESRPCSARFEQAQLVSVDQYEKNPTAYEGRDIRLTGWAIEVRYDPTTNVTSFRFLDTNVRAIVPGRRAGRDPDLVNNARLEVAGSAMPGGPEGRVGPVVVFEYRIG